MSDTVETPKEILKKQPPAKQSGKFWQHSHCFRQFLVQSAVSFFLILCTLGCVFYSSFWWENSLFPGLRKIDPLQRDLTIVQAKVDQLDQTVHHITDRGAEIDTLKGQIVSLQQALTTLERATEKDSAKSSAVQTQTGNDAAVSQIPHELKTAWDQIKTHLQQGDVCTDALTDFKTKLSLNASLNEQLQKVEGFAKTPAKSMAFLRDQLENIYQTVKASPLAGEKVTIPESQSWLAGAWKYLSQWIHVRPLENKDEKGEQVSVTAAIEKALQALKNNQLPQTIEYLKSLPPIETVNEWLSQAEQRQLCDRIINEMDKILASQPVKG